MNPKDKVGHSKVNLGLIPGPARVHIARALMDGAMKYGPYNWRDEKIEIMTYLSAAERHIAAYRDREEVANDSELSHLAHAAASLCILLDALECVSVIDNRPRWAPTGPLLDCFTKAIKNDDN